MAMLRFGMAAACALMALASASSARAACEVRYFAALPVSLSPEGPITSAMINGHPVKLFVNSGAFYSFMSRETAQSINLPVKSIPTGFRFSAGKGDIVATLGDVDQLKFGERQISNTHFIVVSGTDAPQPAILGQNILAINDAEFDLRSGIIRLSNPHGCTGKEMAYWAQPDRVGAVALETPEGQLDPQVIGRVVVNGVAMRAMFSSGNRTAISSKALSKIGLVNGAQKIDTIKLSKLNIGGEERSDVPVGVIAGNLNPDVDLIVGLDFYLNHRIYVSKARRTLFFTANGESVSATPSGAP
jgi:predicted aspartyl protease